MIEIKSKSIDELKVLSQELRDKILKTVSKNGGHLSSNIGAVELTVAMHYVFDVKKDPFIFDVSHQSYPHKLLTNRWDEFDTLRQFGGISGYTKPDESACDYFVAGHSSTSISLAVGAAKAFRLKNENRLPIALIGDGSMSAGMAYEALNELGDRKYPVIIILNDNEMSIAKPIGAISKYLSQAMAGKFYQKFKEKTEQALEYLPESASYVAKRLEDGLKLITPGILFEELGLEYIGPVDGHDIKSLIETFKIAKEMRKPVIIHAQTLKGKGYEKAEGQEESWHGVSPFDIKSGKAVNRSANKNATTLFSEVLLDLAKEHENIVGVTAAMPSGTGINRLMEVYPTRFWDVAIAEQHAVTSMAAMAKEGFKPYIAIYSTFLQRAYDQIIHDCCILNLNVVFAIDRAGIVGEDGETHQGAFDISYLNAIPNITLLAPRCSKSMKKVMSYTYKHQGVCAFRYPRGVFLPCSGYEPKEIEYGKGEFLEHGKSDSVFIGYGQGVGKALHVKELCKEFLEPAIVDLVFIKPLDRELLKEVAQKYKKWYIFSDSAKLGGVGQILSFWLQENNIQDIQLKTFEYEDSFITHGKTSLVEKSLHIDAQSIATILKKDN